MARTPRPTARTQRKSAQDSRPKKNASTAAKNTNTPPTKKAPNSSKPKAKAKAPAKPKAKTHAKAKAKAAPKAAPKDPTHKTLFFHDPSDPISGFLSPWYASVLEIDGFKYTSVGHYIMAEKARAFHDTKSLEKILASKSADEQRALGHRVKKLKDCVWEDVASTSASHANDLKFLHTRNSAPLRKKLLPFAHHELVYASPTDRFFGIGLSAADAGDSSCIRNRRRWGSNMFGHSLHGAKTGAWRLANPAKAAAEDKKIDTSWVDRPGGVYW